MSPEKAKFDEILVKIKNREINSRRYAALMVIIPAILAVILLTATSLNIKSANAKVASSKGEIKELEDIANELGEETNRARDELTAIILEKSNIERSLEFGSKELENYYQKIESIKGEIESLTVELENTPHSQSIKQIDNKVLKLQNAIHKSSNNANAEVIEIRDKYSFDIEKIDLNAISFNNPKIRSLFKHILSLYRKDVRWKEGGQTVEEGFESGSFAVFLLKRIDIFPEISHSDRSILEISQKLTDYLKETDSPTNGDLVIYKDGTVRFYLKDSRVGPIDVGMTPEGIVAYKFGHMKPEGFLDVFERPSKLDFMQMRMTGD